MRLADLPSPDVASRAASGALLAVPLGATEQHGAHLPLSTDTDIATALCDRLAEHRPDVLVAPALPYGSSGEHAGFAGTLSIGQAATEFLLIELGRSACETFERLLFVSAHGGNAAAVTRAVAKLRAESRDVSVFEPRWQGDPHAGRPETALQLALHPEAVQMDRAVPGDRRPLRDLLPLLRDGGVRAVTDTGVLGDPTGAGAEEGRDLLDDLTAQLVAHVRDWTSAVVR
ncbi:mycofactocin biosynthesis peptidyl-dipeptidase MftE [Amycolatopsis benzoatilytica]|uniref:mycofactocin biosynthesis peptidyl-dipeptidase MftE n=1 Tax=Amycolatopsis benzoatilytica TaxID=346045 RepID=UPI0003737CA8|nr:mycofactocin biosynthesis peptidyl-dipeptidase MftE [Amycolatopsis benzoatilytica]